MNHPPAPVWSPSTPPVAVRDVGSCPLLVLHYWAVWDLIDREMDRRLATLRAEYGGRVRFRSCDVDRAENRPFMRDVGNVPALGCFIGGTWFQTVIGLRSEEELRAIFDGWIVRAVAHARGSDPVRERLYSADDFEALIRIFGPVEGGRREPAYNGVRWDFAYADRRPGETLYMIWPDFVDEAGRSWPAGLPLPVGVEVAARMTVAVEAMRGEVHRRRVAPGVRFFCHEGGRRVAEGVVTRVTGLFTPR